MLSVAEVKPEIKRALGSVDDADFYTCLNQAVDILSSKSIWNPCVGYMDVCVDQNRTIALPRQVGQVLAVQIDGVPALGHDKWYRFHLNGPGENKNLPGLHWTEAPASPVVRALPTVGAAIVAVLETSADNGAYLRVEGYDADGNWIRTTHEGEKIDGFVVPTSYSSVAPNPDAPAIRVITRVVKAQTNGTIRLNYVNDDESLTLLGQYWPQDTVPLFRRIQVNKKSSWVRIAFRRVAEKFSADYDIIPLHSSIALVMMAKALKKYDEDRIDEGAEYERKAVQFLTEKQSAMEVPSGPSIQIADGNLIADRRDRMD